MREKRARLIGKKKFSARPVYRGLRERCLIIGKYDHQIAWSGRTNKPAQDCRPCHTRAILRLPSQRGASAPCLRQDNTVWVGSFIRGPFHWDPSMAKITAKFHDHVTACKRKEEPAIFSGTVLILCFHHRCYFRLCVNDVLSLEYSKS